MRSAFIALLGILLLPGPSSPEPTTRDLFDVVVIDPGHGGEDEGALGIDGVREKLIALRVAKLLGVRLQKEGLKVVFTREDDRFMTLAERSRIANESKGDLYLSIHANSAPDRDAHGPETYFLSLQASDEEAQRVAFAENQVFGRDATVPDSDDIVGSILGDLILTDHLRGSSEIAASIQRHLAALPGPDRGVKQAPFVVLMGVNMPAALVEIGFLSHPEEARKLQTRSYQQTIATALARAITEYRDGRYGEGREEARK